MQAKPQHYLVSNTLVYHLTILDAINCIRKRLSPRDFSGLSIAVQTRLSGVTADVQKTEAGRF